MDELEKLLKCSSKDASYLIGLFYGKIKLSNRLSTFYGSKNHLSKLKSIVKFYISREGDDYVCIESIQLSKLLSEILRNVINNWSYHKNVFKINFLKGYYDSNLTEVKLGGYSFYYIKGKKRILKELKSDNDFITEFSTNHILYIPNETPIKYINDFDSCFNISVKDQYRSIIGLLLGDGHMKKYDYIQITHTDKQKEYITFLKIIFDYWGFKTTIGNTSNTSRKRKDGSIIYNHYFYIRLDNKDYFKNRINLNNKQVNSYLASRLNSLSLLFWFLDDGNYTDQGMNLFTNGFDNQSLNVLKKYLKNDHFINCKKYLANNNQYFLHFSVDDTKQYQSFIKKYIKYLPNCFSNKFKDFDNSLCII